MNCRGLGQKPPGQNPPPPPDISPWTKALLGQKPTDKKPPNNEKYKLMVIFLT